MPTGRSENSTRCRQRLGRVWNLPSASL